MIKYRIKTEQEFLNDFGRDWRHECKATFPITMNHLLGISLEEGDNIRIAEFVEGIGVIFIGGYSISEDMRTTIDSVKISNLDLNHFLEDELKITLQQNN